MSNIISWPSMLLCLALVMTSCKVAPEAAQESSKVSFQYTVSTPSKAGKLPVKVYVFPPLPADFQGRPTVNLKPVMDGAGGLKDWQSPAPASSAIRSSVQRAFERKGYKLVGYPEVMSMDKDHSIAMVSLFYTEPSPIKDAKPGKHDKVVLTMVTAKTFPVSLDPSAARQVAKADGMAFFSGKLDHRSLVEKSFDSLIRSLGDNTSGFGGW